MFVYEMQGRHTEVDATLKLCLQWNLDLNAVVLWTLMEATAARVDPKRADALWEALVHPSQVEPNFLCTPHMQKCTFCPDSLKMQSASLMNWCKSARGTWTTNLQLTICKRSWLCATRLYLLRIWPPSSVSGQRCNHRSTQVSKVREAKLEVSEDVVPETPLKPRKPLLQRPACYKYRQSELDARLGELPGRYQLLAFARLKASELLRNCEGFMQGRHWQVVLGTSTAPFCLHFDTAYSYHVHKFVKVCRMIRLVSQTVIHLCWRRAYLHAAWWYRLCLASWQVRRKGSPPKAHQLDIWWCMHAFLWGKWHYASVVSVWFR